MCSRYARRSDKQKIAELFAIHGPVMPDFGPSWNVAAQTFQPIVCLSCDTAPLIRSPAIAKEAEKWDSTMSGDFVERY
jgi:hypothetical protein